jgi:hypothetical protein
MLRQPMEVWFSIARNQGREANTRAEEKEKEFTLALLPGASGELFAS